MNNYQWLLQMDGADRKAWFDAEHVETEERALDGDTDALNAKIAALEKKLRISWEYECKFQAERDELQAQVDELKSRHCPHYDANEHTCDVHETRIAELTAERERYRKLFGMALDWAHEITMLETSIDEGMA